jgi:tetratricopeptide (TPR) repeat protein
MTVSQIWQRRAAAGSPVYWGLYILLLMLLNQFVFGYLPEQPMSDGDSAHYLLHSARVNQDPSDLLSPEFHGPRPVTDLTLALIYALYGDDLSGYHLVGALLHIVSSLALAVLCRKMGMGREASFLSGLFFFLGVAKFRNVFFIAGLSYHLALIVAFTAVALYLKSERTKSRLLLGLFCVLLVVAVLCHPAILFVAPFCLMLGYQRAGSLWGPALRLSPVALAGAAAVFCLAYFFQDTLQTYHSLHFSAGRAVENLLWLLGRQVTTAYWLWTPVFGDALTLEVGLGVCALAGVSALVLMRGRTLCGAWACWTILALLPFVNRLPRSFEIYTTGPSRYLHLASVGVACLTGLFIAHARQGVARRFGAAAGMAVCIAALAVVVSSSIYAFGALKPVSFYMTGVYGVESRDLEVGGAQLDLALAYGEGDRAIAREAVHLWRIRGLILAGEPIGDWLRGALKEYPQSARLYGIWGAVESVSGDSAERVEGLAKIATAERLEAERIVAGFDLPMPLQAAAGGGSIDDFLASVYGDLAESSDRLGDHARAIAAYQQQLQRVVEPAKVLFSLGVLHARLRRYEEAISFLRDAVRAKPQYADAHYNLGLAHMVSGDLEAAVQAFRAAIRCDPESLVRYRFGVLLAKMGRYAESVVELERVLPTGAPPTSDEHYAIAESYAWLDRAETVESYYHLGVSYNGLGRHAAAVGAYRKALTLQPRYGAARAGLVLSLLLDKDRVAAGTEYEALKSLNPGEAAKVARFFEQ